MENWDLEIGIWNLEFGIWNLKIKSWNFQQKGFAKRKAFLLEIIFSWVVYDVLFCCGLRRRLYRLVLRLRDDRGYRVPPVFSYECRH